jgi:branched-chain amino acid transport system substrate-binding protein
MKLLLLLLCFCFLTSAKYPKQVSEGKAANIKIGLLIQDARSLDAIQGAELAIKMANDKGGYKGSKFQLIIRTMEGPWGTGSKEAVDLIFNEKVYGLIGSHDGRNAHLVEQVCAKSHVNFISAKASDPTLSQAFVPWFFNCVPNDLQQSALLIKEVYHKSGFKSTAVVCDNSYDANTFIKNLLKKIKAEGLKEPMQYLNNVSNELRNVIDQVQKANPECIILAGQPDFSKEFLDLTKMRKIKQPVYSNLFSIDEKILSWQKGTMFLLSSGYPLNKGEFCSEFEKNMGEKPTEAAAYAFDATTVLIDAICKASGDREMIRTNIANVNFEGASGTIGFDEKGNRIKNGTILKIVEGNRLSIVNKAD